MHISKENLISIINVFTIKCDNTYKVKIVTTGVYYIKERLAIYLDSTSGFTSLI